MMYSRWSLNYLVSIGVIRCTALFAAYPLARTGILSDDRARGTLAAHLANARDLGLARYLRLEEFVHRNADGPANPYALMYDRQRIERDFPSFRVTRTTSASCAPRPCRYTGCLARPWHGLAFVGSPGTVEFSARRCFGSG